MCRNPHASALNIYVCYISEYLWIDEQGSSYFQAISVQNLLKALIREVKVQTRYSINI
jgi:hypothetical protein